MKNETINVGKNDGIISIGDMNTNIIQYIQQPDNINWERLSQEIKALKSSPDASIQKFADEAAEEAVKKDCVGIRNVLLKWIPCIAELISSSYYILEIAKTFNILK